LIGTDGQPTTGSAAGLKFDKIVGDPYVLDPPLTAGSLAAAATSVVVWRSTDAASGAPVPLVGDIIIIQTPSGTIRSRITAINAGSASGTTQKLTFTLAAAAGKSLSWTANQPQIAKIVRPEAFIVMPQGDRNQLRFYPRFDPMPTLSDATQYRVLTDQIGTETGEGTPFTMIDLDGDRVIQSNLRVRETMFTRALARTETNSYSGYFQLLLNLPSRLRPKTTN
jgi:hypothetical protein